MENTSILAVANRDTYISPFNVYSKENLQRSYIEKIGEFLDFDGKLRKVLSVKVTEDWIYIELE